MKQDGSMALFHYWNRLRDGRPAPKRTEIEPADIKSHLADTFILERDSRGEAVFRLAGTRLCAIYGRELKGFSFPSMWRAKDQRMVARLAQSVFSGNSVIVLTYEGYSRNLRSVGFELLLLPLEGGQDHQRALGIISATSRPYWLGADAINDAVLESVRVVDPEREPMFLKNRPAMHLPLPSSDIIPPVDTGILHNGGRRIRHLVVLPGGRQEQ